MGELRCTVPDQLDPTKSANDDRFAIDASYDPELDAPQDVRPAARPTPPKGPDGKFLPRQAETTSEEIPHEAPRHSHPKSLVKRALDLGYSQTEIAARDTDTLLDEVHAEEARELRELRRQSLHQKSQDSQPNPIEQVNRAEHFDDEDRALGLDEQTLVEMTPDVKRMLHGFRKQNQELQAKIEQLAQMEQTRQNMTHVQKVDAAFNSLGLSDVFGQGSIQELNAAGNKDAVERRLMVNRLAGQDESNDPINVKIQRIARTLFGHAGARQPQRDLDYDNVDPLERNGHPTPAEWNAAAVARPDQRSSHRDEGMPRGEGLALRNAAKRMGVRVDSADEEKSRMLGN